MSLKSVLVNKFCRSPVFVVSLLALSLAGLVVFVEPFIRCPPGHLFYRDTGFCCKVTTCGKFQQVDPCKEDGGRDSCKPCPPHTYMMDNTMSMDPPFKCVPYNCDPETSKEVNVSSKDLDPHACPKFCQCDMSKGYCGTDPCRCQRMTYCGYGKEQNQQCWCVPIKEWKTTVLPVTSEEQTTVPPDKTQLTTTILRTLGLSTTVSTTKSSPSNSDDNWKIVILVIVILILVILIVAVVIGIIRTKRGGQGSLSVINVLCGGNRNVVKMKGGHVQEEEPMVDHH